MTSETVDEPEDEDRRSEGDRDRKASRPRDRTRVAPTPARHVEHAQSPREDPDEGSRDRGQREREQGRTDKENGRGGHRGHDNDSHAFGIPDLTRSDRRSEGDRDRQASRPRDRTRVAPTPARHVEHAQSPREDPDEGSRDRGQREREQGRTDKENGRGGHRGHDNDSHAFGIPDLT